MINKKLFIENLKKTFKNFGSATEKTLKGLKENPKLQEIDQKMNDALHKFE